MLFRVMRIWAVGFTIYAASHCAGCSLSPATHSNGLPRISRYTNALQLEWALSRYSTLAAGGSVTSSELVREACHGWRKMTFDLASARQYPRMLRMSAEAAGLLAATDELPAVMSRHPLPAGCQPSAAPLLTAAPPPPSAAPPPSAPSPGTAQLAQTDATPPVAPGPSALAGATSGPAPSSGDTAGAPSQTALAAQVPPIPAPAQPAALTSPPTPADPSPALPKDSPADDLLAQWERLIEASGVGSSAAEVAAGRSGTPNLQVLAALADSPIPAIRLRARFHLLGQCASALAATERLGQSEAAAVHCVGRQGSESLHITQARLLRSLLSAWRGRGPEPFSDWVVALASFAARDNPVLDGPRIAR